MKGEVRGDPAHIDAHWLTEALEAAGVARGAEVTAVELAGFIGTAVIGSFLKRGLYQILIAIPILMAVIALTLIPFGAGVAAVAVLLGLWGLMATAAPVGWCDAAGDGEFFVAIRAAVLRGDRAWTYAGAGLVPGSDPAREWDETEAKMSAMRAALGASER